MLVSIQEVTRKNPVIIIGSGHSAALGLPGMGEFGAVVAEKMACSGMSEAERAIWDAVASRVPQHLEEALQGVSETQADASGLLDRIRRITAEIFSERSRLVERAITECEDPLGRYPLGRLMSMLLKSASDNKPIVEVITTNYDLVIESLCDRVGLTVETGFSGYLTKTFDPERLRSPIRFTRHVGEQRRQAAYVHKPGRLVRLLKPHGSVNWFIQKGVTQESQSRELSGEPAVVVPGPLKYRDTAVKGVFDEIRTMSNAVLRDARAVLTYGYGFRDEHLQTALRERLRDGMPALIVSRSWTEPIKKILVDYPQTIGICSQPNGALYVQGSCSGTDDDPIWQLDCLLKKAIER